jgi:hypothetical protein
MPREPIETFDDLEGTPGEPRPPVIVGPTLVSHDATEEALASMLRVFGVFVTAGVLGEYWDVLKGVPREAVYQAVKRWIRRPAEDRAARPHELRAMAEAEVGRSPAPVPDVADLEGHRATADEISAAYAEALRARPDQEFLQWAVAQRARRLAGGESGEGEAEAAVLVGRLAGRRPMPVATGGEP